MCKIQRKSVKVPRKALDLRLWRSDVRFLAPVVIMAVNTSNPFKAIRQLIEETNKDLSILQEGVEKKLRMSH